jgi:hypothetical protein
MYIFKRAKLLNFTKYQGVCLNDYKQKLIMKSLIKHKMRVNIFIHLLASFS